MNVLAVTMQILPRRCRNRSHCAGDTDQVSERSDRQDVRAKKSSDVPGAVNKEEETTKITRAGAEGENRKVYI